MKSAIVHLLNNKARGLLQGLVLAWSYHTRSENRIKRIHRAHGEVRLTSLAETRKRIAAKLLLGTIARASRTNQARWLLILWRHGLAAWNFGVAMRSAATNDPAHGWKPANVQTLMIGGRVSPAAVTTVSKEDQDHPPA
eukprot:TRINITY_DN15218_c0_g1_i8.p1 TRINITY_DN15218_c0_g1~~TRINITY_DN15218_c0_g1_i8.p1  ORF type:complete len:139 (+),score=21.45 TRINITY_DN15218_c0_g1_i8:165-581(+)